MKLNRSLGFYLLACSGLCGLVGYESYQTKVRTAKEIASRLELQFESVSIPIESYIAGFLCIAFAVAGMFCLKEYFKQVKQA
jgi:hypothetical protein